ncbi:hypothetical protein [Candidatus Tisiphia endosymbiont of Empis tessellata]|uniref:tetratricopeptide repeat protein n=1 Tax=Candidatus Tisiphia endosymbiont of Empis tessellata TaxID=3066259 RepID=UPI00313E6A3B
MSKIAQIFQKRSSPNKSASLDRSTVNDTGTEPVLALKFKYFQDALGALNQQYGDIQKISTALDQSSYTAAQAQYKILYNDIKKDCILKPEETKQLLFKTYEYQAISAFRAGEFKEHNIHLLHAYNKYGPDRDKSIIGLERWVEIYKTLGANAKDVPSISPQYDSLLKEVKEEVQLLIKTGKYDQARAKMEYLNKNSHNFQIFDLYFSTIKYPNEALKYFEDKSKNNLTQRQDIHNILKKWQDHLSNQVNDKEVAAKAAAYVLKYNSNPTVATAPVKKAIKKAVKEVERDKEKYDKSTLKLKTVITVDEQEKQLEELKAKHEAKLKAELEKLKTEHKAELEALKPKASPTKDTKVDEAGDSSTTSSLPPAYTSIDIGNYKYLQLAQETPSAPTAPIAKPLDETVLKELIKLAHLIPSLNWQDSNYNTTKGKAKSLLIKAVKENPDVYKTIEDSKILVLLADVLLSSNKMEKARIVCKKALDNDPNIWQATDDQIVLLNLAGVLLPSNQSSEQLKAEQIYSKAISIRIYFKDERGNYEMDVNRTTIVSKTVAQDGYSAAERDCLAKVCLGGKVYQQVQAIDCYPHTDVAKREAIAGQLKQLAKQLFPVFPSYTAYTLCSKASSVLENDLELRRDMKKIYDYTCPYTALPKYSAKYSNYYPPTEESTTYLTGECANSDY